VGVGYFFYKTKSQCVMVNCFKFTIRICF